VTRIGPAEELRPTRWASGVRILAAIGLVAVVCTAAMADYLSSWLPPVGGLPAGAILRDGVAVSFVWAIRRRTQGRELVLAMIGIFAISSVLSTTPDAPVFATTIWILVLAVSHVADLDDRGVQPVPSRT